VPQWVRGTGRALGPPGPSSTFACHRCETLLTGRGRGLDQTGR